MAGQLGEDSGSRVAGPGGAVSGHEDFLTALKRRNKPVVDEERWAGTILGREAEDRDLLIEGGEVESVNEWSRRFREKNGVRRKTDDVEGDTQIEAAPG